MKHSKRSGEMSGKALATVLTQALMVFAAAGAGLLTSSCTRNAAEKGPTIWVQKPDGSLQCGMGGAESLEEGARKLKEAGVETHASEKRNDGQMRIQLCGSPTGDHNAYRISESDLGEARKVGYRRALEEQGGS